MLMRTDPFRELDRLSQQFFGNHTPGTWSRPASMPLDAYRRGDEFVVHIDLPGVAPEAIELEVERNVLTVKAERRPVEVKDTVEVLVNERQLGAYSRQMFLGDTLDADNVRADYHAGVLTLTIPVREQAKPRKISIGGGAENHAIDV